MTKEAKNTKELPELRKISVIRREFAEAEKKWSEMKQEEMAQEQWLNSPEGKVYQEVVQEEWVKKGMREKAFAAQFGFTNDKEALQKEVNEAKERVERKIVEKSLKVRGDNRTVEQYFADEYERLSGHKPMSDVRSPSGISKTELEHVTTEKGRGIDENVAAMSGADDKRLLQHYTQQITGTEVAAELVMENKDMAKKLYAFVNGKEPSTEQMAKMMSASIAYTKLHPTSEIPNIMAKRETLLAPKGNKMARETVRE